MLILFDFGGYLVKMIGYLGIYFGCAKGIFECLARDLGKND